MTTLDKWTAREDIYAAMAHIQPRCYGVVPIHSGVAHARYDLAMSWSPWPYQPSRYPQYGARGA